jgi:hypothetical protein
MGGDIVDEHRETLIALAKHGRTELSKDAKKLLDTSESER